MQDKPEITYFLYARKSSEDDSRQVQSIDDQVNQLQGLAAKLGVNIKATFTEAKSAKEPDARPIFADMLKRIEQGEAQGILCWALNRLSRNPIDSGKISWMLQQGALQSIQAIDREYLPEDNVLLFNVETGMPNQFIIDLRKVSKRGMAGKAERGWLPSRAPVGYLNQEVEFMRAIVADPERFDLVRKMWDLLLTGNFTVPQIRKIANEDWGFRTPKRRRSGGTEISIHGIYKMFSNLFYTGMFEWNGKFYQGNHKPMITLEEYDQVQVILGRKGKPRSQKHEFAYTGLMSCAVCGSMYTASEKKKLVKSIGNLKTYTYYHCTKKKKGVKCDQPSMTLKELEEQIDIALERFTILPKFQQWALDILSTNHDQEVAERTKIYRQQQEGYNETQKELDNLVKLRCRELIDDDFFLPAREELQFKLVKLKSNLRQTENRADKWIELTEQTFNFARYARRAFITGDLRRKREIFAALDQNFMVRNKKVLIQPNEWLVPIEKAYPELEAEFKRLELDKSLDVEQRNERMARLISSWRATVQEVRTIFERIDDPTIYIPTFPEEMDDESDC